MQPGCKILCNVHLSGSAASSDIKSWTTSSLTAEEQHEQLLLCSPPDDRCRDKSRPGYRRLPIPPSPRLTIPPYILPLEGLETMIARNIGIVNIMPNAWFTWALDLKLSFWRQQDLKLYCLLYSFYLIPIHLFHTPLHSNHPTKSGVVTQSLVKTKSSKKDSILKSSTYLVKSSQVHKIFSKVKVST